MYFWRIEKLKKSLSEKKPSQKEIFFYYLGLSIFTVFFINLPLIPSYSNIFYRWIEWGSMILVSLITIIGSYFANGGGKGIDFLERFISIYFVIKIRYWVFLFFLGFIISLFSLGILSTERDSLIIHLLSYSLMTYKTITHIKEVSSS